MTTLTTEPRQELVLLEPTNRAQLDADRSALIAAIEAELPAEIISPSEYAGVAELEARIDRFVHQVQPLFDDHCSAAHKVWKSACAIRAAFLDAPQQLKATCRLLLSAYKTKEDRIRRDEERRLAEEQRQIEIERQKAEAKLLEAQGQKELAKALRATPVDAPAVVLPSIVPEVQGLSYREDWYWEPAGGDTPHNRRRAIRMIVREEYADFLKWDDAALTAWAKRNKGTSKIPGIVVHSRQVPVRR